MFNEVFTSTILSIMTSSILELTNIIDEQNGIYSKISQEIDCMTSTINFLETQLNQQQQENLILKEKLNEEHDKEGEVISCLMKVCSKRVRTMLITIWSLSTISNVVDQIAQDENFINFLVEMIRVEVIQDVLEPVLGILANLCYSKKTRSTIGQRIVPYLFDIKLDANNQSILATLFINLTEDEDLSKNIVENYPIFEILHRFFSLKNCFKKAERIIEKLFYMLNLQGKCAEFAEDFISIAKKFPIKQELKREIGMLAIESS